MLQNAFNNILSTGTYYLQYLVVVNDYYIDYLGLSIII